MGGGYCARAEIVDHPAGASGPLHHAQAQWPPQSNGFLTVIGRASPPAIRGESGGRKKKPILFPREKRLLTAVRRKVEARAHVI